MLIETKEVLNFRNFMKEKAENFIANLIYRMVDEFEYEGRRAYTTAIKEYFSKYGNTTIAGSGKRFVVTIQLNDFQKAEVTINAASYKWRFLQSKSKAMAMV